MKLKRWYRNLKLEYWKTIEDYPNYMISSLGRVKSLNYRHTGKERILKPAVCGGGYLQIGLSKNSKRKMIYMHRLVLSTFKPIPNMEEMEVNHIDENKTNNNIKNLEWVTREENCNWGTRNKRVSEANIGKHHTEKTRKKISEANGKKVRCIEENRVFNSLKEAYEWCGLKGNASIIMCCRGERNYAGKHPVTGQKLTWMYVD